ncbi:hypothetical protein V2O64_22250 [Verrucomicrobiaceae bacterium 227]
MMNTPDPTTPPPIPKGDPLAPDAPVMTVFENLLKNPGVMLASIREGQRAGSLAGKLTILTIIGIVIFGVTLGSFSFGDQLWAAPLKAILGIAFSALICLPSLYIFAALTGTSLRLTEIALGLAAALALTAALLLGFTPVLWVFSQSTSSGPFFGFLVILTWIISVSFGTGFLLKMLTHSGTENKGPVRIWIGIFLLVTLQMSTTLRPLIGTSSDLLTSEKRFFLEHWTTEMSGNRHVKPPGQLEEANPRKNDRGERE